MSTSTVAEQIQSTYDEQYNNESYEWRRLGAKFKAKNINRVIEGKTFDKVLEFGAGDGSILTYLEESNQFNKFYALEISESGIKKIEEKKLSKLVEVKKFDGYKTDFADNEFDLVYCSHVIEHVEHPRLVLREIKRISKSQVFEIPLDYSKTVDSKLKHFLDYGHINIFTPALFKFLLKSEGFVIKKELHTITDKEIINYNWYRNLGLKKSFKRQFIGYLRHNKARILGFFLGEKLTKEYFYDAYTCFTENSGNLEIFNK